MAVRFCKLVMGIAVAVAVGGGGGSQKLQNILSQKFCAVFISFFAVLIHFICYQNINNQVTTCKSKIANYPSKWQFVKFSSCKYYSLHSRSHLGKLNLSTAPN